MSPKFPVGTVKLGVVSLVSRATMAADRVSAAKRIPSGPTASWLMDLSPGFPSWNPVVQAGEAAWLATAAKVAIAKAARGFFMGCGEGSNWGRDEKGPMTSDP